MSYFSRIIPQLDFESLKDSDGNIKSMLKLFTSECTSISSVADFDSKSDKDLLGLLYSSIDSLHPKGTESYSELETRILKAKSIVKKCIQKVNEENPDLDNEEKPKILIVSHNGAIVEYLKLGHEDKTAQIKNLQLVPDTTDYESID
mmetsp:Transcript_9973/g.11323  ORF Transcript_9973/g.11323 Transcript_9973/m.11323 type:complete len:147 (+) Transcript_9973:378-818(+)